MKFVLCFIEVHSSHSDIVEQLETSVHDLSINDMFYNWKYIQDIK